LQSPLWYVIPEAQPHYYCHVTSPGNSISRTYFRKHRRDSLWCFNSQRNTSAIVRRWYKIIIANTNLSTSPASPQLLFLLRHHIQ
jgi:hypothetical protein